MCGADSVKLILSRTRRGPSPRVRGRLCAALCPNPGMGTIPACAGQTQVDRFIRDRSWDHPRVCGADPFLTGSKQYGGGTIPACAGQTPMDATYVSATRDHPRVCGADTIKSSIWYQVEGPSPRVRGRRIPMSATRTRTGTIPACAGQTK